MMSTEKRILCVGLCVLDFVHVCDAYPEEDSDKRTIRGHWQRGGNASNNCSVLRNLGAKCEFLGVLSNSPAFQFLAEDFIKRGILIKNCPKVDQDPIFSSVLLSQQTKSRTVICTNQSFPILTCNDFKKVDLNEYEWIHFEARNHQDTDLMIKHIVNYNSKAESSIKLSVELEKPREEDLILTNYIDYVFVGRDYATFLGWKDLKSAAYGLKKKIENKHCIIICTWGSEGAAILDSNYEYSTIKPHPPKEIIDTLGAGDTFCAAVLYALNAGKPIKEAVEFGSKVTGFKLSSYGYDCVKNFNYQKNEK